jgi:uncharacterized protein (TIGR03067 family)
MRALWFIPLLTLAVPDRQDPTPPSAEQLAGEWQVVTALGSGQPIYSTVPGEAAFIFEGNRMTIDRPFLKTIYEFTIDTSRNPWMIEIRKAEDVDPVPGIAKIENGMLSLCINFDGPRPTEFTSTRKSCIILWELKRGKK